MYTINLNLNRLSETIRNREDLALMALGAAAAVAPLILPLPVTGAGLIILCSLVAGLLVAALAALDMLASPHWEEPVEMLIGAWLVVSPYWLGYSSQLLAVVHVVTGALIFAIAAIELWQDMKEQRD